MLPIVPGAVEASRVRHEDRRHDVARVLVRHEARGQHLEEGDDATHEDRGNTKAIAIFRMTRTTVRPKAWVKASNFRLNQAKKPRWGGVVCRMRTPQRAGVRVRAQRGALSGFFPGR